jgi:hypothetical protein
MNIGALRRDIERHGLPRALADSAFRLVNRGVYLKILRGITIAAVDPHFLACDGRYSGQFIPPASLRQLSTDPVNELDSAFLDRALARGDECYGLFAGDALASYGWYANRSTEIDAPGLEVVFDSRYIYMYKGFTHPDHRGQRLHAVGMTRALESYLARGFLGLVSFVEWQNSDSLKSCYRMGYRDFGDIYVVRIFGRYFFRSDAGCRPFGFSLRRAE